MTRQARGNLKHIPFGKKVREYDLSYQYWIPKTERIIKFCFFFLFCHSSWITFRSWISVIFKAFWNFHSRLTCKYFLVEHCHAWKPRNRKMIFICYLFVPYKHTRGHASQIISIFANFAFHIVSSLLLIACVSFVQKNRSIHFYAGNDESKIQIYTFW